MRKSVPRVIPSVNVGDRKKSQNNLCLMCPFQKGFRRPLHGLLASFEEDVNILMPVSTELDEDLRHV